MELIFASRNQNKIKEISAALPPNIRLLSLDDIQISEELPETGQTIEANAEQKARYVYERSHANCFADDTGLEVAVLNGLPGVDSAFYAGPQKNAKDNIAKLLSEMAGVKDRSAVFKTIISLIINDKLYLFEGLVKGYIAEKPQGEEGFGYDPVFIPEGSTRSFAQMPLSEKNLISHRAMAVQKLVEFLRSV